MTQAGLSLTQKAQGKGGEKPGFCHKHLWYWYIQGKAPPEPLPQLFSWTMAEANRENFPLPALPSLLPLCCSQLHTPMHRHQGKQWAKKQMQDLITNQEQNIPMRCDHKINLTLSLHERIKICKVLPGVAKTQVKTNPEKQYFSSQNIFIRSKKTQTKQQRWPYDY